MKQLIVLVALIAAAYGFGEWKGGLSVRFDVSPLGIGSSHFIKVPRSVSEAKNARWVETVRPAGPLPSLHMYCPSQNDRVMCALYDDTDYVAGIQVALPVDAFADGILDWDVQGFTRWTPPSSGTPRSYWTLTEFFINEATLEQSVPDRLAARNPDKTLQEDYVWVTGFNKERMAISVDASKIAQTATTHFTRQACMPLMGRHYYYNMTANTQCTSDQMLPWFPLVHSGELIGMGFVSMGKLPANHLIKDYFERPDRTAVRLIVPDGPNCLYDIAQNTGMVTMHTYFIDKPWLIDCLFQ